MKYIFCIIFLSICTSVFSQVSLEDIRLNYIKSVSDKKLCKRMIDSLTSRKDKSLYLGYLGGYQTIWANHVFNPFTKLSTFNRGKKNIDTAIKSDISNPELRYIRLSVQKNAPSFLDYSNNIGDDTLFLKSNRNRIHSSIIQTNIDVLLKN